LPALIQKYEEKANIVKLKKVYSVLLNATNYMKSQDMDICYFPTPPSQTFCIGDAASTNMLKDVREELTKLLDPVAVCGCDYNNRCGTNYPWAGMYNGCYSGGGGTIYKDMNGNPVGSRNIDRRVLLLKDGTLVYLGYLDWKGLIVTVDVNGIKGPNILSKDLFLFVATPRGLKPYGSPDTNLHNFHNIPGVLCDSDYSKNTDAITIFKGAGSGCAAKYLIK